MSPPAPVRLGVLGCGWIAGNRLRQIAGRQAAEVVAVVDPVDGALDGVRAWAPAARALDGIADLVTCGVDGVMISTPSALHGPQAEALLDEGLALFVQKPLAIDGTGVARVLDAAAAANVPLATDLCYRHLACSRAMRAALQRGDIGRPFWVEGCFHNAYRPGAGWSHDPRLAGGGALMDLGLHLLDLVMWLTDRPLELDRAVLRETGRRWQPGGVEDFAALELHLPGDVPVRLVTTWDASTGRDADIRLRLLGEQGCLEMANRAGSFFDFDAWLHRGTRSSRLARDEGDAWQAGPLAEWLERVSGGDGYLEPRWVRRTMALIDAAYGSPTTSGVAPFAAEGSVHVFGRKGVAP